MATASASSFAWSTECCASTSSSATRLAASSGIGCSGEMVEKMFFSVIWRSRSSSSRRRSASSYTLPRASAFCTSEVASFRTCSISLVKACILPSVPVRSSSRLPRIRSNSSSTSSTLILYRLSSSSRTRRSSANSRCCASMFSIRSFFVEFAS